MDSQLLSKQLNGGGAEQESTNPTSFTSHTLHAFHTLSIIIPCFNEKSTILDILQVVQNVQIPYHKEIIIVDDYSSDGTREILATLESKKSADSSLESSLESTSPNCSFKILYHEKIKARVRHFAQELHTQAVILCLSKMQI